MLIKAMKKVSLILIIISFISCSSLQTAKQWKERTEKEYEKIDTPAEAELQSSILSKISGPEIPEFTPVQESSSPLQTKTVSIAARHTPLREVLHIIASTANLNLVMERDVEPELPVTMTVNDITVQDALSIIFDSMDYFYTVKGNILIVKATGTEMFEIGQPNLIQDYKIDLGGDILSGTASSSSGSGTMSGDVSMSSASDKESFKFWDSMEKTLKTILFGNKGEEESSGTYFVINRMSGSIMVTASKKELQRVGNYIATLKKILNRQVLVEARIVEVQLSESLKYGIDWVAVGEWLGAGPMGISATGFTNVIPTGSQKFEISIFDNDNIALLLRALEEQGDVKTLSNPRLNIMNGQTSILSVGRNTTFISRVETTTTNDSGSAPIITYTVDTNSILSGIMFGLAPYINSDGEITMSITPIITNLVSLESQTIGSGDGSVEIKLPTVDLREMSTTVKVLDNQVVIIGGLIDKQHKLNEDKIPILGNIPFIGEAFKSVDYTYENKELVIILTPRLIS